MCKMSGTIGRNNQNTRRAAAGRPSVRPLRVVVGAAFGRPSQDNLHIFYKAQANILKYLYIFTMDFSE